MSDGKVAGGPLGKSADRVTQTLTRALSAIKALGLGVAGHVSLDPERKALLHFGKWRDEWTLYITHSTGGGPAVDLFTAGLGLRRSDLKKIPELVEGLRRIHADTLNGVAKECDEINAYLDRLEKGEV